MTAPPLDDLDRFEAWVRAHDDPDALAVALNAAQRLAAATFVPLPHQRPPAGRWARWLFMGGRGAGKTEAVAAWLDEHMQGPPCDSRVPGGHRAGIIAPTLGDAIESMVTGPSGLRSLNPEVELAGERAGAIVVRWPNGSRARLFGAHTPSDVDRLRSGGNRCADAYEELAAWSQLGDALANAELGLRLGPDPRAVASTTPRNRPELKALKARAEGWPVAEALRLLAMFGGHDPAVVTRSARVVLTRASTADNPYLAVEVRDDYFARYGGTRLGRQELEGELVDDVGSRFARSWFPIVEPVPGRRQRVRYWDLAATPESPSSPNPDWTAGALVEYDRGERRFHVVDVQRFRAAPGEVQRRIEATARLDTAATLVAIEQDPGQAGKDQVLGYKHTLRSIARVHAERPTGSKELRAQLPATAAEAGRVTMSRGEWNYAFLDELEEFPDGDHDDQVDALSGAFAVLERGLGGGMTAGTSAAAATHGRVLDAPNGRRSPTLPG